MTQIPGLPDSEKLTDQQRTELLELVSAVCDERSSAEQRDRLENIVLVHDAARVFYVQYLHMHAAVVRCNLAAEPDEPTVSGDSDLPADRDLQSQTAVPPAVPGAETSAAVRTGSPVLGFLGTAIHLSTIWLSSPKMLAMTVLGGLTTYFVGLMISIAITRTGSDPISTKDPAETTRREPARILAASGCRWQDRTPRVDLGSKLPAGTSHLVEGVVDLEFDGGARVRIEGPAEFAALSGQRMQLVRGRMVAYVPKQARGFTVGTPTAEVIDLGTEFDVEVDGQGSTDLHVTRGRVEVKPVSGPREGQVRSQRVVAGESVRVSAGSTVPERMAPGGRRLNAANSATAVLPAARPVDLAFPADQPIWLGNLFDDDKTQDNSLVAAMRSDTFKAFPVLGNSLGVERFTYGSDPVTQIAPGVWFDCMNLGWRDGHPGYHRLANDAISVDGGGIRLKGEPMEINRPKIEEGIGMHANALITFDLDEIRAAGELKGRALRFVCDRAGINDDAPIQEHPNTGSVHMVVLVSSDTAVDSALVDGTPGKLIEHERTWSLVSVPQKPLHVYGPFFSADVPLPAGARYLTLLTASAGDGLFCDHGVWVGARLEVAR